jgi:hypothetical protein
LGKKIMGGRWGKSYKKNHAEKKIMEGKIMEKKNHGGEVMEEKNHGGKKKSWRGVVHQHFTTKHHTPSNL